MYKIIVTLPEIYERDSIVLEHPSLQNPTHRKPVKDSSSKKQTGFNGIKN
jgi:hypothetical protein